MTTRLYRSEYKRQNGVALVISLLVLLVMTMIGLAAMRTTMLEEKMAGNMQDKMLSFQAAEAALRAGENALTDPAMDATEMLACVNGNVFDGIDCYVLTDNITPAGAVWTVVNPAEYDEVGNQVLPQFYIEHVETRTWGPGCAALGGAGCIQPEIQYFRVTGRGIGGSADAVTVLRSYFGRL